MQVNVKQEEEDDDESNSDPTGRLGLERDEGDWCVCRFPL